MMRLLNQGFLKDDVIGLIEFDLSYLYSKPKHVIQNQWVAFSNPDAKDMNAITAQLKFSV